MTQPQQPIELLIQHAQTQTRYVSTIQTWAIIIGLCQIAQLIGVGVLMLTIMTNGA